MATVGLDKLFYAPITEDGNGYESYGKPAQLAKAITASISVEYAEGSLYADDVLSEYVREFKSGKITLGVDDIGTSAARILTGARVDSNGALIASTEDKSKPVAIGFRSKKSDGTYRYFWFYRVVFAVPSTELETKNDSISFKTPSIEGTIMRRNRNDMEGRHPWKAQLDENSEGENTQTALQSWYSAVYEPVYTVSLSVSLREVKVGETVKLSVNPVASVGTIPTSYAWYKTTEEATAAGGGELLFEGTSSTYETPPFEEVGTHYFYCKITKYDGIAAETVIFSDSVTVRVTQGMV